MSSRSDQERKAMFANMQNGSEGVHSSQIGMPNQIPVFEAKSEDHLNEFAESQFKKFESGERKIIENKKLSDSEKSKKFEQIEEDEQAVEHLSKTVQTVQSPNTSGHEKFTALDDFLKDKKYTKTLPSSIRKKLETQRDLLKKEGFGKENSTSSNKEHSEELMHGKQMNPEGKIKNG